MKLEIVSMVRINGKDILQSDIPKEEFQEILLRRLDEEMAKLRFKRVNKG